MIEGRLWGASKNLQAGRSVRAWALGPEKILKSLGYEIELSVCRRQSEPQRRDGPDFTDYPYPFWLAKQYRTLF